MKIAAHRGNKIHAPENSRQALLSAYTAGADVLEFDLQLTKDDMIVLSHDPTIKKMTDEDGVILNMTLKELRHTAERYDFSAKFNPNKVDGFSYYKTRRRLQIENFEDVLDLLPSDVWKLIELKHNSSINNEKREIFVRKVVDELSNRGMEKEVVLYSSDIDSIKLVKSYNNKILTAAFTIDWDKGDREQIKMLEDAGADGLVIEVSRIVDEAGNLTDFSSVFEEYYKSHNLNVGLVLYPHRPPGPGVFLENEFNSLKKLTSVWSLSTDSMIGADVDGTYFDIESLLGRQWQWIDENFSGTNGDRNIDLWNFGYAKNNEYCKVFQRNGIHIKTDEYDGKLPQGPTGDDIHDKLEKLDLRLTYVEKDWKYYSGGGLGLKIGITGNFIAEVDYEVAEQMTQAVTLEMAVLNVDPGSHRSDRPESFRDKDSFYDPHGAPPYVGVEHDEDDGYRINWNLGNEYDNNQYGPPVGDGKTPQKGRLRLERRAEYFSAYYRNDVDAPHWICVGSVRNGSLNPVVYLRCVAKRWRQEKAENTREHWPIQANEFIFKNLTIKRYL